jgi:hypothetical protein
LPLRIQPLSAVRQILMRLKSSAQLLLERTLGPHGPEDLGGAVQRPGARSDANLDDVSSCDWRVLMQAAPAAP